MGRGAKRPRNELVALLTEQRAALAASCESFDKGNEWEAARIATTIFNLVHDGGSITSLLTHLGLRAGLRFLSSNRVIPRPGVFGTPPLVGMQWQAGVTKFVPRFMASASSDVHKALQFETWWAKECVYSDIQTQQQLTRKRIVFTLRHQDGGGHVGVITDSAYAQFKAGGGVFGPQGPILNGIAATMRQIAWETTETLKGLGEVK